MRGSRKALRHERGAGEVMIQAVPAWHGHDASAGRGGGAATVLAVFQDGHLARCNAKRRGRFLINFGVRLAVGHTFGGE